MQATDCRRAFPCWDEPDFKAVFGITLVIDPALLAVSNGPEVERNERPGGKVAVRFADTMVMSTYLVAFVVGPLEATDAVDVDGIPLRVVHVPGKGHLTGFGLDVGAFSLRWFQDYYGIPYPSDKVDLLALPDFAAGAMENLGCITFRESLLLVDPATATMGEQQLVADVVAHELAHMWFGDLVTMRWWNGIWLNEAFATFMELAACDAYRPDWGAGRCSASSARRRSRPTRWSSTRPVEYEVRSPQDCEGMFDVLTYQKGGALLRMLEQYLGAERFREGVSHYLRLHPYGNTETNDLWDAIEETSGEPVRRMMDSWIWQPGYPLVSASVEGGELVLRQQRFAFDDRTLDADVRRRRGWCRCTSAPATTALTVLLEGDEARVTLADPAGAGRRQRRRPRLLPRRLQRRAAVAHLRRGPRLARHARALQPRRRRVERGRRRPPPGRRLPDVRRGLRRRARARRVAGDRARPARPRPAARRRRLPAVPGPRPRLLAPVVAELGDPVDGEDDLRGKLRGLLVAALAIQGDDAATQAPGAELYEQQEAEPGSVDPELVAAATSIVAASGDEAVYERLLAGYRTAATPQEQLRHLYALAEFDSEALMLRTCELAMSDEVKTQNAPFLLRSCIANRRHGRGGVDVRPPALGRGQRRVPEQHDRAHGRLGAAADRRARRRRRAGVLRRAPDRAGRQDPRSGPRAPARQHRPAGPRAGALRRRAVTPTRFCPSRSARSGRSGRTEAVRVELRGIEPLASTVRLLRSTN